MEDRDIRGASAQDATYSTAARRFHWWTVAFVAVQIPVGLYMAYRGNTLKLWDGLTNALYSSHKLLGITILVLVLARLIYRLSHGAPPDEPTITWWQKGAAHLNHWGLYLVLLVVPILGYIGISLYPALDIFGLFSLPGRRGAEPGGGGPRVLLALGRSRRHRAARRHARGGGALPLPDPQGWRAAAHVGASRPAVLEASCSASRRHGSAGAARPTRKDATSVMHSSWQPFWPSSRPGCPSPNRSPNWGVAY